MSRRRLIIALACAYFALQVVTISCWYSLGSEQTHTIDLIICITVSIAVGLLDTLVVRRLFHTMRTSESAYTSKVSTLLERSFERYQNQSLIDESIMKKQLREITRELNLARQALATGDYDTLDKHMNAGLDAASLNVGPICDNTTVAAILTSKSRECAEAGVTLSYDVRLPEDLSIQDIDLAAVLFNLIDNSLNECKALAEEGHSGPSEITVFARVQAEQLAIKVTNPCRVRTNTRQKVAIRRRDTFLLHGWGIHIVTSIAASYGGIAQFQEEGGVFSASVLLPQHQT